MSKTKLLVSFMLALALLSAQVGTVLAASPRDDTTPITGTVQSITLETDSAGVTTVLVTLDDGSGNTQTVRISVDTAVSLNLVTLDANNNPVVNDAAIGTTVTIDPGSVISDNGGGDDSGGEGTGTSQNPVATALENFFSSLLGVDYNTIMTTHDQGVGFGVIAQALFLTEALGGDTTLFTTIVDAKQSGDYSAIVLPDGTSPTNWGQFKKALLDHKQNLGQIMSGSHGGHGSGETMPPTPAGSGNDHGNGQGNGNGNGQGNSNGHGNSGGNGSSH